MAVTPAKRAAYEKLVAKIKSGQRLTLQENYDYTHKFPEFLNVMMKNESDRGSDPNRQGVSGLPNFTSSGSRSGLGSGTPVPNTTFKTAPTRGISSAMGTGTPVNTPGNSLASWPATTVNNSPGNSLSSWPATTSYPYGTPGNSLASWPATNYNPPPSFGYNDSDRGSDPNRQPVSVPGHIPAGVNDQDRGSDPNRQPVTPGTNPQDPANTGANIPWVTKLPDEQFPNIPNVTLSWHDFTKQAQQKVAGAYAPLYQAINQGRTNATNQSTRAQAITKGMYDQLAASDTAANTATDQRYNQAMNTTKASNAELQNTVAGAGSAANADLAATMAQAGLGNGRQGTAAADILSEQIGRDSAAGLAAKTQAAADETAITNQQQSQADYGDAMVSADRQSGRAAREDLINQLSQVLQQYDQQNYQTKANEAQQGLSLGQQMSQNDWTAQTGSADQTWNAYNAAMGQTQAKIGLDQANAGLQNQASQAQLNALAAQAELAQKKYEFDTNAAQAQVKEADQVAFNQAKLQSDQQIAQAKINVDNARTPAEIMKAQADLIKAYNQVPSIQGKDPSKPGYSARDDPTSAEYQLAHNPVSIWRQGLLGITSGQTGGNQQQNQQRADALGSFVASQYGNSIMSQPNIYGGQTAGLSERQFINDLITVNKAQNKGFTDTELEMAARAYQQLQSGPATVIPSK